MAPRPLAPHVLAAIAAVQRKAADAPAPRPAPRVASAPAWPQARITPPGSRPAPHVLAAIQARPAPAAGAPPPAFHVQAAIQARPAASAAAPPAPHVRAAIDRARSPGLLQAKAAPYVRLVVQPMEQQKQEEKEETEEKTQVGEKRKRRASVKLTFDDPFAFLDDPSYGKNENYEQERAKFDKEQRKKFERFKKRLAKLKTIPHVSSNKRIKLSVLDPETFLTSFEDLKGNTKAEKYALSIEVEGQQHLFKTSYNQDVGFAPLYLDESEEFRAGKNRPFKEIAGDLDDFIGDGKALRKQVGKMIKQARDGGNPTWGEEKPKEEKRLTLETAIAELAIIFSLDIARAGDLGDKARSHQDALLKDSGLGFQDMLANHYIGIKASRLRDEEEYKRSKY